MCRVHVTIHSRNQKQRGRNQHAPRLCIIERQEIMSRRNSDNVSKSRMRAMVEVAVITAVTCVLGPLAIPIGPVPISLTPFAVFLGVYILGMKKGTIAYVIYLLIGMAGVPVLSGFTGGVGKVLGPTGGYLMGFILMALVAGLFIDRFYDRVWLQVIGMITGLCICYAFGTIWLAFQAHLAFKAALLAGVIPFIPFDIAKIAVSVILGRAVRNRLIRVGVFRKPA